MADDGPRDTKLEEKKWEELPNQEVSPQGREALDIDAKKWKHAETENFILHYRRVTEAKKVAREIEYDLWFVAKTLGAEKKDYARKSHVYVFEDEAEWKSFLGQMGLPEWVASYALGDELFLNVRQTAGANRFDSQTLAHETTHAVVARLYVGKNWPLWLGEGFAEYMGGASVAARKNQTVKRHQGKLRAADMPLEELVSLTNYPSDRELVSRLYQTSEQFVRFLMNDFPPDRFPKFIDAMLEGGDLQATVLKLYGDKVKDWSDFMRKYERFSK